MFLFSIIMISLLVISAIVIYNFYTAPVFRKAGYPVNGPLVSVLIPARNEELNIAACLDSLIVQDYTNYEVIVGNDNSTDRTASIVDTYSGEKNFIKRIDIPPVVDGWLGKNFAAYNLYKAAKGDVLLFIDADVMLDRRALSSAVSYLEKYKADIISVFPEQLMLTRGERIIVPLLNLFMLTLLPLRKVYKSKNKLFTAAIGQFMLFRREAYQKTGGHEAVKNVIAEDIRLAYLAKENSLSILTLLDGGLVSCRMYNKFNDALDGFTKNFFKGTSLSFLPFMTVLTIYFFILFFPFAALFIDPLYIIPAVLVLLTRVLVSVKSGQNPADVLLHPVQISLLYFTGIRSVISGNSIKWKGRSIT